MWWAHRSLGAGNAPGVTGQEDFLRALDVTVVNHPEFAAYGPIDESVGREVAVPRRTPEAPRQSARDLAAWCWQPARPSKWRWRRWPMLVPFAIAMACTLFPLRAALLPEFAPRANDLPQNVRDHAALLWVLCWLPTLRYVLSSPATRRPIPFMPIIGILYGLYYALSPALGFANYWGRDPVNDTAVAELFDAAADYAHPVNMALVGWIACLAGRELVLAFWRPPLPAINRRLATIKRRVLPAWGFALAGLGLAIALAHRVSPFAAASIGAARMLTFVSHSAIIVLIVCYRNGHLSRRQRSLTWAFVLGTVFMDLGAGATAKVLYIAFAIFIGLWIGRRAIPLRYLVSGAVVIAACISIRGVMDQWRLEVWLGGRNVPPLEQSEALIRLLRESAEARGIDGTIAHGWDVIARRSSNSELLADVMRRTPADIPYWNGFTYTSLVGALVPRVLWPDKPTKTLGQDFGHRYSYLAPNDHYTSINLPVLIEFYINFGDPGIVIGMFLVGIVFALLDQLCNRAGQCVLMTAAAAPLLTQLFVMECDLSLQYGGLVMQLAVLFFFATALALIHRPRGRPWYLRVRPTLQIPSLH